MNAKRYAFVIVVVVLLALLVTACSNHNGLHACDYKVGFLGIGHKFVFSGQLHPMDPGFVCDGTNFVPVATETASEPLTDSAPADSGSNEHGNLPQPQIGHPNYYVETGVQGKEFTWTLDVADGEMAIVGGTSVNGLAGGTYIGLGPGHHVVKVIDGFAAVTKAEWAKAEWDFRIGQTEEYGWAHTNVDPGPIQ